MRKCIEIGFWWQIYNLRVVVNQSSIRNTISSSPKLKLSKNNEKWLSSIPWFCDVFSLSWRKASWPNLNMIVGHFLITAWLATTFKLIIYRQALIRASFWTSPISTAASVCPIVKSFQILFKALILPFSH